ncbi:MAG: glycosyltransferase family 39 protein [Acidobacteriota bacterium]|nr:glycosyltransferase family 39 protein [Acidobacteriota bacterium]
MDRRLYHRLWAGLSGFLLIACLFVGLGAIGLLGPDEPRYASIARTMAQTGDWVTPRLWGHPWFEKPILFYWAAAASFKLFGVSEGAARLPNALAALAGALLLALAAWRLWGGREARLALVIFPTSIGIFAFARAATMDMLLAVSLEAAMVAALFVLSLEEPPARSWRRHERKLDPRVPRALVGACIGLGTLAKGPVAIILAGGSVLLWAALTGRWRDAMRFLRWEPVAAFAVVALPWYIACSLANPDFARSFLWHQNVQRFLTPVFEHVQPWWFFFPILALGLVPWTPALVATARDIWRVFWSGQAKESPEVFVACWAIFPLLFFSFSKSKLPGYILPALPPLILLLARTISGIPSRRTAATTQPDESGETKARTDPVGLAAIGLVGIGWVALAASAGHWLRRLPPNWGAHHHADIVMALGATALVGLAIAALAVLRRPRMAVALSALWMGLLVAGVGFEVLPRLDPLVSARAMAESIVYVGPPRTPVEQYHLQRDWTYGLNYYFGHELPEWSTADPQTVCVYTTWEGLATIERSNSVIEAVLPLHGQLLIARVSPPRR